MSKYSNKESLDFSWIRFVNSWIPASRIKQYLAYNIQLHILRFICHSFLNIIQFAVVYVKEFQCQNTANFSAAHLKCCKLIKRNKVSTGISLFIFYPKLTTHSSEPLKPTEKLIPNGENIFFRFSQRENFPNLSKF